MLKNYKNFKEEIVIDFQGISGYQFSQGLHYRWNYQ